MYSSSHAFKTPDGLVLKMARLGFGIKTCRNQTVACAPVEESEQG